MAQDAVIVGGGVGGLACALALAREGASVCLMEQADVFSEIGAGLQLGPNAVRVLHEWGLGDDLRACAAFPQALQVRDAHLGRLLGQLHLGPSILASYGQPYATLHRADLHALLLGAVQRHGAASLLQGERCTGYDLCADGVQMRSESGRVVSGGALIGCDGLWSAVRTQLLGAQAARSTGHLAYRGLVRAADLPEPLRRNVVTAWLGPRLHVVHYPVRAGEWFNVVAVVQGVLGKGHAQPVQSWSHEADLQDLQRALGPVCTPLADMIEAVPEWRLWALNDRPPMKGPHEHAQGRIALLGDAAHPLRPYLAQGAAMAIEDAWTLGRLLRNAKADTDAGQTDWPSLLGRYARTRWQRNARVQAQSARNGTIFHADGLLRLGRNVGLRLLGERLMDNGWLYSGPPHPIT
jgi:salicylate hydroxylase